jgi:RHS repeat-associated protein
MFKSKQMNFVAVLALVILVMVIRLGESGATTQQLTPADPPTMDQDPGGGATGGPDNGNKSGKIGPFAKAQRVRLTPLTYTWASGGQPAGTATFDVRKLFDTETTATYSLGTQATIQLSFREASQISALKVFGAADGIASVTAWNGTTWAGINGLTNVPLSGLGARWNNLQASAPITAQALRLSWVADRRATRTAFAEFEFWGQDERVPIPDATALLAQSGGATLPNSLERFNGMPDTFQLSAPPLDGSAAAPIGVTFNLDRDPADFCRAFLVYEVKGWSSWVSIRRSVNGRPALAGALSDAQNGWSAQVEEINPAWLNLGSNTVEFAPSGASALSSDVRNPRIIGEINDGSCFTDVVVDNAMSIARQSHIIRDGDFSSGWSAVGSAPPADSSIEYRFERSAQLESIAIGAGPATAGTITIDCLASGGWSTTVTQDLARVSRNNWNVLPLANCSAAQALRIRRADPTVPTDIRELVPIGSIVGTRTSSTVIRVTYPDRGRFTGREAYIRGFIVPWDNASPKPAITIGPLAVDSSDGSFDAVVSKEDMGLWDQPDPDTWSVPIVVSYPDGRQISRAVTLDQYAPAPESIDGRLLPTRRFSVRPEKPSRVSHDDATLELEAGTVAQPVEIAVTPLNDGDLAKLDTGMTNVTRGPRKGYRFEPHGMKFQKKLRVSLPYNPGSVPPGVTDDEISTFYFDQEAGRWIALERIAVDKQNHRVVSFTDHFTDMINATVTVPDHPQALSYNPTSIKDIKVADPGAEINLIEPPQANSAGSARLTYPIEIPPGRVGMQPNLAIQYDSSKSDGWLGLGWDLQLPSITVDTRWGVPRYSMPGFDNLETENYLLNGEELTPLPNRLLTLPRQSPRVFHARVEGRFEKVVRYGNSPGTYWWEVTEKNGKRLIYGSADLAGVDRSAVLIDGSGNIFKWMLRQEIDTHGNSIRYEYTKVCDRGVDPADVQGDCDEALASDSTVGSQIYPQSIHYTERNGSAGAYTVTFVRDRELPSYTRRPDVSIDARGGFKMVTADLLKEVRVSLNGQIIRSYELTYEPGAFQKQLLTRVDQFGKQHTLFNSHKFEYFGAGDDLPAVGGSYDNGYVGFADERSVSLPSDNINSNGDPASALSGTASKTAGAHVYVGYNHPDPSKYISGGIKAGESSSSSETLLALIDIDGDSLSDKVVRIGDQVAYRANQSKDLSADVFGELKPIAGLTNLSHESSDTVSGGGEAYFGANGLLNDADSIVTNDVYLSDVNGDGLVDQVRPGQILFNRIGPSGGPEFDPDSNGTPLPIPDLVIRNEQAHSIQRVAQQVRDDAFPLHDTIRLWEVQSDGIIQIAGAVHLIEDVSPERAAYTTADGVRVAIQHNGEELWSAEIDGTNYSPVIPQNVEDISVARGERIYFRVQSRSDGAYDQVAWDPEITYRDGSRYRASEDFVMVGRNGSRVSAPFNGTLRLDGFASKSDVLGLEVLFQIIKNGDEVLHEFVFEPQETGSRRLTHDFEVRQGDTIELRVAGRSPFPPQILTGVDPKAISWVPSLFYVATTDDTGPLVDKAGHPLRELDPAFYIKDYQPPQFDKRVPWVAPKGGTIHFGTRVLSKDEHANGTLYLEVKAENHLPPDDLLARIQIDIVDGHVQNSRPSIIVSRDDVISFDYQVGGELRGQLSIPSEIEGVLLSGNDSPVNFTAKTLINSRTLPLAIAKDPYRGWFAVGYDGTGTKATEPIDDEAFVVKDTYNLTAGKCYGLHPRPELNRWVGPDEKTWVAPDRMSSTRLGASQPAALSVHAPTQAGLPIRAVPRLSHTTQSSAGAGAGFLSGSATLPTPSSVSDVDYMDLNGDRYPDVIANSEVQYTTTDGGLEAAARNVPGLQPDTARASESETRTFGIGGNPATAVANARAKLSGRQSNPAQTGGQMPALGVNVDVSSSKSQSNYDLMDLNGDGLPDRVQRDDDGLKVSFNLGYRFAAEETWDPGDATLTCSHSKATTLAANLGFNGGIFDFAGGGSHSSDTSKTTHTLTDLNGDGLLDRVQLAGIDCDGDPSGAGEGLLVAFNSGSGFEPSVPWQGGGLDTITEHAVTQSSNTTKGGGGYVTIPIGPLCLPSPTCYIINNFGGDAGTGLSRQESGLIDLNGDGYPEYLYSGSEDAIKISDNQVGRTNLLKSFTRPLGSLVRLDYSRVGNSYDQPLSEWALARVEVYDGVPGDGVDNQVTTFEYENGFYDRQEREFYGFGRVTEHQLNPVDGDRSILREYLNDSYFVKGLLKREVTRSSDGRPFLETENSYDLLDVSTGNPPDPAESTTATVFPRLSRTDRRFHEGQPIPGKTTFVTYEYDANGNVRRVFDSGDTGSADDVDAVITYFSDDANHILDTPDSIVVRGNGQVMRQRYATIEPATGNLLQVRQRLEDGREAVTDLEYFPDGNLMRVVGPANLHGHQYTIDYEYDPTVSTHLAAVTDAFGYRSTATFDLDFGKVKANVDINGQPTSYAYDLFGRVASITGPYEQGTGLATIRFEYHPEATVPKALTRHADPFRSATDTIDTVVFVDGLKRVLRTKKDGAVHAGAGSTPSDVMIVSGCVVFDAFGRTTSLKYPTTESLGSPLAFQVTCDGVTATTMSYDVLDRTTEVKIPDGTKTTTTFGFGADRQGRTQFETLVTDANGISKRIYRDVRELIVGLRETNRGGSETIWTSYAYDPLKQITRVTDDLGNVTVVGYDNLGRRTVIDNPDAGRVETIYDLASNPIARVTPNLRANGKRINFDYDYLRLVAIRYPDFPENNVAYVYGAPGAGENAAGRITVVTDESGSSTRGYGKLGEMTRETKTVASDTQGESPNSPEVYTTRWVYDTFGRLQNMTYPDGELLTYRYDSGGMVSAASGVKGPHSYAYVNRLEYDKFEQRAFVEAGNGVRTIYTYRPDNRRLQSLVAAKPSGRTFQNLQYSYDPVGNILGLQNQVDIPPASEYGGPTDTRFRYDDLYRLISTTGLYQFMPNKSEQFSLAMDYNTIHNILSKGQNDVIVEPSQTSVTQKKTSYSWTYAYGGSQPHAPTHLGERTFYYDGNGNQIGWNNDRNGTRRTIVWDEENRIQSISDNGHTETYKYNDLGERVIKRGPQGETAYVNSFFTIRNREVGTKHVFVGVSRMVSKLMKQDRPQGNPNGNQTLEKDLYFYHPDHLGSSNYVTDADAKMYEHLEYFPFGEAWIQEASNKQRTPYQFTSKELDEETGLTYLSARYLDSRVGNFLSADPLLLRSPDGGRASSYPLSQFAYANRNPVRYLDPSGEDAVSFYTAYRNSVHDAAASVHTQSEALGDAAFNSGAPWWVAATVDTLSEFVGQSVVGLYGIGTLPEALAAVPDGLGHGMFEIAEGIRSGNNDRVSMGVAEVSGNVATVAGTVALVGGVSGRVARGGTPQVPSPRGAPMEMLAGVEVKSRGNTIATGIVDLRATLRAISSGQLKPRNVFGNFEGRLPKQPLGYYEEFVNPTPGIQGAGPQRVIRGAGGEFYYTADHYKTFVPLN